MDLLHALTRDGTQEWIYEFACHEGNYGIANILSGARAKEAAARECGSAKIAASTALLLLAALSLAPPARAQQGLNAPPVPTLDAVPAAAAPPILDGDVLGESGLGRRPFRYGLSPDQP